MSRQDELNELKDLLANITAHLDQLQGDIDEMMAKYYYIPRIRVKLELQQIELKQKQAQVMIMRQYIQIVENQ